MSTKTVSTDLYDAVQERIPDEKNEKLINNTLLYPIAKAFLETFPQYYDIIRTYEYSVESISDIVGKDSVLNEFIKMDESTFANFKVWIDNVRIYPPDSMEAYEYSNFGYVPTPNVALADKGLYSAIVVGDLNYSYTLFHKQNQFNSFMDIIGAVRDNVGANTFNSKIPNGYKVNMPIPIGCKWCALRHYDPTTLIKSAEEMKSLYGFFIVRSICLLKRTVILGNQLRMKVKFSFIFCVKIKIYLSDGRTAK